MPYENRANEPNSFDALISIIKPKSWIKEIVEGMAYEADIDERYEVRFKQWFQFSGHLDINFVPPDDSIEFFNKAYYALTIDVVIKKGIGKYSPQTVRDEIISFLSKELLGELSSNMWWHITASQISSFIYLHDISQTKQIFLASAKTYVKQINKPTASELSFCSIKSNKIELLEGNEDEDIYFHKTKKNQIIQYFEQKQNPVELYHHQVIQHHELSKYRTYSFRAVEDIDTRLMMRVRRLFPLKWLALETNHKNLLWGFPKGESESTIRNTHKKIRALGLKILQVKESDVDVIFKNIQTNLSSFWMYHSEISRLSFPVALDKRMFWFSKSFRLRKKIILSKLLKLLELKFGYENQYGFDNLMGNGKGTLNSLEIRNVLFDMFTIRGRRMIDIGFNGKEVSVYLRIREGYITSSSELASRYVSEFDSVFDEVKKVVTSSKTEE